MGINLTWVCHTHKKHHTSLRGEEGIDFQYFVREMNSCPSPCLRSGQVIAYHDGYVSLPDDYTEMFPRWSDRPAELQKADDEMRKPDA